MKRILSLLLFLAATMFTTALHAQHFDWVKSYSGQEPLGKFWNYIVSSVTDSHGNLYVAGQFANGATIDGQSLLPFSPHGGQTENPNSCIMKISPQGNILWTKILHANYGQPTRIYDLQLVGDTALYANVSIPIPKENNEYLYFYDTLITKDNLDYLLYMDSISYTGITTAISSFDLDGNLNENYLLHMAYKDSKGKLITLDRQTNNGFDSVYIANEQFKPGNFHVDNLGNIYFGHLSTDLLWLYCDTCASQSQSYNLSNGLIGEIVVMVNGHQRFFDAPISHPSIYNFRIFKFSPHFNDMLACRYIFYETNSSWSNWSYTSSRELTTDNENNVFLLCNINSDIQRLPLSGDTTLSANLNNYTEGMVIKFDDELTPLSITQLTTGSSGQGISMTNNVFNQCIVEPDSNSIIVLGSIARAQQDYGYPVLIGQDSLDIQDACAYFVRIDNQTGALQSHGHVPTSSRTTFLTQHSILKSIAQKNRIITLVGYKGDIQTGDSSISIAPNMFGAGLYICDYEGNYINYIDYGIEANNVILSSSLSLHDSILYITGGSQFDLKLNNTQLSPTGNSTAYIACYIDTAFMTSYIHTEDPGEVSITLVEDGLALVAYPNPFRQSVRIKVQGGQLKEHNGTVTAILTDLSGRRGEVRLTPDAPGQYTLDLTSRPQATYLLTLTTSDGRQHTVRLLKQSDIFGN
ncbi:MAG: T9SS type A sorting domain-containing protein [Bacteroidales bacterium]|nr:T9SS type A sorting domain-containing protein [Candidatus Colimorpha pelethequi]